MTRPTNIEGIEKATGKNWDSWVASLNDAGAQDMTHKQIVRIAYKQIGEKASAGWWSQHVAVAYEQHIGRRQPGQRQDGTYEVTVSKTASGSMDDAMSSWLKLVDGMQEFNGVKIGEPKSSRTDKRRHWGVPLEDGTRVDADVSKKDNTRALLAITHIRLKSPEEIEKQRAYWKEFIQKL